LADVNGWNKDFVKPTSAEKKEKPKPEKSNSTFDVLKKNYPIKTPK